MSMVGRRGLLKTLGLAPLARDGKHKHRETPVGWTNQAFQLLIVNAADGSFSGAFVYSPGPGNGNLIASIAAAAGTDPYGNSYQAGVASYNESLGTLARLINGQIQLLGTGDHSPALIAEGGGDLTIASGTVSASDTAAALNLFSKGNATNTSGIGLAQVGTGLVPTALALPEITPTPATPTGQGYMYVDSTGHLHYLGPGGTNTTLAGP